MGIDEIAEVVDFVVNDAREVFGRVVRSDRIACEGGVRHVDGVWEGGDRVDEEGGNLMRGKRTFKELEDERRSSSRRDYIMGL